MVALPTPARAATSSTQTPSNPCAANTSRVASMMAWSAASLRGRPSRRTDPVAAPVWMSGSATVTGCMVVSHLPLSGLDHVFFHYGQFGVVVTVLRARGRHRLGRGKHRLG